MTKKIALKLILSVLCFLNISMSVVAQDTIFYKKAGSIVVFVKEVSQTEVQYKKLEMPDGPMYIIDKNDIAKIVYKNGYTETLKEAIEPTPVNQPLVVTYEAPISASKETISYRDTKRRNSSIVGLISRHPNTTIHPELTKINSSMKNFKAGQDATRTVAIVFGAITIPASVISVFAIALGGGDSWVTLPVTTGAVALVCTAAAVTFNINLKKKRRAFVDLYNQ